VGASSQLDTRSEHLHHAQTLVCRTMLTRTADVRTDFAKALSTFIPFLSQTSIQIANRLEQSQKEHDLHEQPITSANGDANEYAKLEVAALQLETVVDLPIVNTRAGLYIFLNSLVRRTETMTDKTVDPYSLSRARLPTTLQ
jgi:mediator of RNA polymerase II transcription subunit 5